MTGETGDEILEMLVSCVPGSGSLGFLLHVIAFETSRRLTFAAAGLLDGDFIAAGLVCRLRFFSVAACKPAGVWVPDRQAAKPH